MCLDRSFTVLVHSYQPHSVIFSHSRTQQYIRQHTETETSLCLLTHLPVLAQKMVICQCFICGRDHVLHKTCRTNYSPHKPKTYIITFFSGTEYCILRMEIFTRFNWLDTQMCRHNFVSQMF